MAPLLGGVRKLSRRQAAWLAGGAGAIVLAASWKLSGAALPSLARPGVRVLGVSVLEEDASSRLLVLETSRGPLDARHYPAAGARVGVVWLSGATREWGTPARNLYPRLADELRTEGVTSLWLRHRDPANFDETVLGATAAMSYLAEQGATTAAIVGHSFGGAIAIQAALAAPPILPVRAVVALATQADGTRGVGLLAPHCALLLIHGDQDRVLPPINAAEVYRAAGEPKEFRLVRADHSLSAAADEVAAATRAHILTHARR